MPLMKSRSKKALEHNIKMEMEANPSPKDHDKNLAIAYSVQRKAKKKASGGMVQSGSKDMNYADGGETKSWREHEEDKRKEKAKKESMYPKGGKDYSGGQRRGPEGYPKYQEQAQNEKGVHTPVSGVTSFPHAKGTSRAGDLTKDRYAGKPTFEAGKDHPARKEHERVMEESRKIKPNIKGMYDGGEVNVNDKNSISRNSGNKPAKNDSWTDNSTIKQAQANDSRRVMPIKHPKMVPQNAYSVRLRSEEDDLQSSSSPGPYGSQPPKHDDEMDAKKQGSDPDMASQHNNKKKPYNKAIEDQYSQDMAEADMKRSNSYANGGPVMEPEDDSIEHQEREYERQLQLRGAPSHDEGASDAHSRNEMGPNRKGPSVPDMEEAHSEHDEMYEDNMHRARPYANGGSVDEEEEMEHAASLAAAIMAKRKHYARGGEIMHESDDNLSADSMESDDSDQADLSRNADEDANMEDQASFDALKKENYSESDGLDELDNPMDSAQHGDDREDNEEDINDSDIVAAIRRKSKIKSAISR